MMSAVRRSSEELFGQLVDALLDEGRTAEEFDIDAMPFAQLELFGPGLGRQLARRIQEALAERQGERMAEVFDCPQCGRACRAGAGGRRLKTLDGDVEFAEPKCFCKTCRKAFFPSA
jgi:hypothetical protein